MARHYEQWKDRQRAIIDASLALLQSGIGATEGGRAILEDSLRRLVRKHGETSELKGGKYKRIRLWSPAALQAYEDNRKGYHRDVAVHHDPDVDQLVRKLLKARTRKQVAEIFVLDRPCVVLRKEHREFHKQGKPLPTLTSGPNVS